MCVCVYPTGVPKLMHYGLLFEVGSYKFDKHWHYDFDVTQCPPWDLSSKKVTAGIFPPPPHPKTLTNQVRYCVYVCVCVCVRVCVCVS